MPGGGLDPNWLKERQSLLQGQGIKYSKKAGFNKKALYLIIPLLLCLIAFGVFCSGVFDRPAYNTVYIGGAARCDHRPICR